MVLVLVGMQAMLIPTGYFGILKYGMLEYWDVSHMQDLQRESDMYTTNREPISKTADIATLHFQLPDRSILSSLEDVEGYVLI